MLPTVLKTQNTITNASADNVGQDIPKPSRRRPPRRPPARRRPPRRNTQSNEIISRTGEDHTAIEQRTSNVPIRVRDHLQQVAAGKTCVDQSHLEALVARLADREDRAVEELAEQVEVMFEALVATAGDKKTGFSQAVDAVLKFARLHQERQRGLLRLVELLHKISLPQRPHVQITAVAAAGVQIGGGQP